jgi:hypothetical protein
MLCLVVSVGWLRVLLHLFSTLFIAVFFNDSGASFGRLAGAIVLLPEIYGPALSILVLASIAIFAWLKRWTTIAIIAVVPVAILDISPPGTFNRAVDAIYFARTR